MKILVRHLDYVNEIFEFEANVKDSLTGKVYNKTNNVHVYNDKYKIELLKPDKRFRMNSNYTNFVKLLNIDGSPVVKSDKKLKIVYGFGYEGKGQQKSVETNVVNGIAKLNFRIEDNGELPFNETVGNQTMLRNDYMKSVVSMDAHYDGERLYLPVIDEDTNNCSLDLNIKDEEFEKAYNVGEEIEFEFSDQLKSRHAVVYNVVTRKGVIVADQINNPKIRSFKVKVTSEFYPKANIVVHSFCGGTLPAETITVNVNSFDERISLLKTGNDIESKDVKGAIEKQIGCNGNDYLSSCSPDSNYERESNEKLQDSGLIHFTNIRYPRMVMYYDSEVLRSGVIDTNNTGKSSITRQIPDSITSWFITSFAINKEDGFGLSDTKSKIKVFRPFFIRPSLPYSVIRGETVAIPVTVYNYVNTPQTVELQMENNGEFEFVTAEAEENEIAFSKDTKTKNVVVPANDGLTVSFLVKPKKVGYISIKVIAISASSTDGIIEKLLVKPEGDTVYKNKAKLLNLKSGEKVEEVIDINLPENK
ncbi:CD109 antigen-like protein, partial [Leptotrombidium deliense]